MIGIYKITNKINGKVYIGQSIDIERRFRDHKNCTAKNLLSAAIKEYGLENFDFEVLKTFNNDEHTKKFLINIVLKL